MGTNQYFQHQFHRGEQNLMDSLVRETIKIHGIDLVYIPRDSNTDDVLRDEFFGEDYIGEFTKKFPIEMYLQNADGMEGEGDLLAKFGIIIQDQATFICSRSRFGESTPYQAPKEGDLIYYPVTKSLFEITYVNFDNPFYQFGKLYTFTINVEAFQFSEETFDVGIDEIDNIPNDRSYTMFFDLQTGGIGSFIDDESITVTGSSFGGSVSDFVQDELLLKIIYPSGSDAPTNGYIIGSDSGASWGISNGDSFLMSNEGYTDNKYLEDNKDDVIDIDDDEFQFGVF